MKRLMPIAMMALSGLFLAAPKGNAAPVCLAWNTTVTLAAQQAQNAGNAVCDAGNYNFDFSTGPGVFGAVTPGVNSAQVAANTSVRIDDLGGLSFRVTFTADGSIDSWTTGGTGFFNYIYTVTPNQLYGLVQMDLDVTNALAASGSSLTVFKQAVDGDGHTRVTGVALNGPAGLQNLSSSTSFSTLHASVTVTDSLTLNGAGARIGNGVGFAGSVANTLTYTPIPEPVTMLLSGAGLIGLALIRRRTKKA